MSENVQQNIGSEKDLSRKQTLEERRLASIQSQVEAAKDRSRYETYEYSSYGNAKLFAARTKGDGHIRKKMPCQDYCLATSVNGYIVLADADGVSACEHSDIGSKFACEAVLKTVEKASKFEEGKEKLEEYEFVNRILSVSFRNKLVNCWIDMVRDEIKNKHESTLSPEEELKEISKYGSTVMFAVISENWIVVGNLGDGQILVFNDSYGIKLRVHPPKESSKVRCLINETCVREDFYVAKYPRKFFNGVLLTTDGMYESLDANVHLFNYALQIKQRFREKLEPYQAFCYEAEGVYQDFSKRWTDDDCSIALFVDESHINTDYERILGSVKQHSNAALLKRWASEGMLFYVKDDIMYGDIFVTKQCDAADEDNKNIAIDTLKAALSDIVSIEIDEAVETWTEHGYIFSKYAEAGDTIEFMYCSGLFRRDKRNPEASAQKILKVYSLISKLNSKLKSIGYELNTSALFNISFDGTYLHVRREAVRKIDETQARSKHDDIEKFFENILGILTSDKGESQPVFDIGYLSAGIVYYRSNTASESDIEKVLSATARSEDNAILLPDGKRLFLKIEGKTLSPLACIVKNSKDKKLYIKNVGDCIWKFEGGKMVRRGDSVELQDKINFILCNNQGKEIERYTYISKNGGLYD